MFTLTAATIAACNSIVSQDFNFVDITRSAQRCCLRKFYTQREGYLVEESVVSDFDCYCALLSLMLSQQSLRSILSYYATMLPPSVSEEGRSCLGLFNEKAKFCSRSLTLIHSFLDAEVNECFFPFCVLLYKIFSPTSHNTKC